MLFIQQSPFIKAFTCTVALTISTYQHNKDKLTIGARGRRSFFTETRQLTKISQSSQVLRVKVIYSGVLMVFMNMFDIALNSDCLLIRLTYETSSSEQGKNCDVSLRFFLHFQPLPICNESM